MFMCICNSHSCGSGKKQNDINHGFKECLDCGAVERGSRIVGFAVTRDTAAINDMNFNSKGGNISA